MNVLRSLARNLWNAMDVKNVKAAPKAQPELNSLQAVRERPVPAVLGLGRFRDGFEHRPEQQARFSSMSATPFRPQVTTNATTLQRDGFESSTRRPVDLSGGNTARTQKPSDAIPHSLAFGATIDDLAALI